MKVYDDSVSISTYTGLLAYKGHEFVREDIEQLHFVLGKHGSLNGMRLQQSKWDWWYDSERNVITLQDITDYKMLQYGFESEKIEICYDDVLNILNFMDEHPDVVVASYKDFQ